METADEIGLISQRLISRDMELSYTELALHRYRITFSITKETATKRSRVTSAAALP